MLERADNTRNYLNEALNTVHRFFDSDDFSSYMEESGLEVPKIIKKGYPSKSEFKAVEMFINTSSYGDSLRYDTEDGMLEVAIVVDCYLPDNCLKDLWLYQDAVRQWLEQYLVGMGLLGIYGRTYTKSDGAAANHFTLLLDIIADVLCDINSLE